MPTGFAIGPLFIHFYGIIIMVGALLAAYLATFEARRRGENPEKVWDMLTWVLIGGVIGARVWHILTPTASLVEQGITAGYYLTHPLDAIATWNGGLGIPGAIIGGALALFLFARHYHLNFPTWCDIVAPGLALGQAIGRWGNFFNQEVYGAPCNLPWCITIDPQYRLPQFRDLARYHPLFLYESLWNLANTVFLLWLGRRYSERLKSGDIFLIYLITYPVGRFFLEFLRLDPSQVGVLNINQSVMLASIVCAGAVLLWRHRSLSTQDSTPGSEARPPQEPPGIS